MNANTIYFLLLSIFLCSSCSQKFYYQNAHKLDGASSTPETDSIRLVVNTTYAGDALDYVVFELEVKNPTNDTIWIDSDNIKLIFEKEEMKPIEKQNVIDFLHSENYKLEREKKRRNTEDAIVVGLNLLAIAFSPGARTLDGIFYSLDATGYILEDRRQLNLAKGSIEEQIIYIEEWVLDKSYLAPSEENSWDILFDRFMVNEKAILTIEIQGIFYEFPYEMFIDEGKVRR